MASSERNAERASFPSSRTRRLRRSRRLSRRHSKVFPVHRSRTEGSTDFELQGELRSQSSGLLNIIEILPHLKPRRGAPYFAHTLAEIWIPDGRAHDKI